MNNNEIALTDNFVAKFIEELYAIIANLYINQSKIIRLKQINVLITFIRFTICVVGFIFIAIDYFTKSNKFNNWLFLIWIIIIIGLKITQYVLNKHIQQLFSNSYKFDSLTNTFVQNDNLNTFLRAKPMPLCRIKYDDNIDYCIFKQNDKYNTIDMINQDMEMRLSEDNEWHFAIKNDKICYIEYVTDNKQEIPTYTLELELS